jgi:hypothetical protein
MRATRKEKALGLPGLWSGRRDLNPRRSPWQGEHGPRDSKGLADLEDVKGLERTRKDLPGLPHSYLMPEAITSCSGKSVVPGESRSLLATVPTIGSHGQQPSITRLSPDPLLAQDGVEVLRDARRFTRKSTNSGCFDRPARGSGSRPANPTIAAFPLGPDRTGR